MPRTTAAILAAFFSCISLGTALAEDVYMRGECSRFTLWNIFERLFATLHFVFLSKYN